MLTEQAKSALWDCKSATYKITKEDLVFSIDKQTQKALRKLQKLEKKGEPVGFHTDELFLELVENCLCNGLSTIRPEDVAALTSSMLFSEGDYGLVGHFDEKDQYGEDHNSENPAPVFWFPNYAVKSPIEDLVEHGKVTFTQ